MANIGTSKKIKSYPNPWTDGSPRVKYNLGWGQYMDQSKPEFLKVRINGYLCELEFGKSAEIPEAFVKEVENARIRYIKNSPLTRYEHAVGGEGRPQREAMQQSSEMADLPMYNLIRL